MASFNQLACDIQTQTSTMNVCFASISITAEFLEKFWHCFRHDAQPAVLYAKQNLILSSPVQTNFNKTVFGVFVGVVNQIY